MITCIIAMLDCLLKNHSNPLYSLINGLHVYLIELEELDIFFLQNRTKRYICQTKKSIIPNVIVHYSTCGGKRVGIVQYLL